MPVKKVRPVKPVRKTKTSKRKASKKPSLAAKKLAIRRAKKRTALKTSLKSRKIAAEKPPLREPVPEPEMEIVEIVTTEVQEYPLGSLLIEEEEAS